MQKESNNKKRTWGARKIASAAEREPAGPWELELARARLSLARLARSLESLERSLESLERSTRSTQPMLSSLWWASAELEWARENRRWAVDKRAAEKRAAQWLSMQELEWAELELERVTLELERATLELERATSDPPVGPWVVEPEQLATPEPELATPDLATSERARQSLERVKLEQVKLERATPELARQSLEQALGHPLGQARYPPVVTLAETKKTLVETKKALAKELAKRVKRLAKALEVVPMRVSVSVRVVDWAQALAGLVEALFEVPTYGNVLAKSKLKKIIYCIDPDYRLHFAHDLWPHRQKYCWLIQIIAPITRLPQELLHQILLIIIDEASDSPLVLMRVSKLWYRTVTRIWASLNLGTTTPKDTVTGKLGWFLDVVVDTEIDRGHFTPSEGAYQAIFAALETTSRWRSLVLETFPTQADLPEGLVNRGLQQCTNSVMNRLRTFKVKFPCEMSPLLGHILGVLGTSASEELTTVEINSANAISFLVPTYSSIFHSITVLTLDTPRFSNPVDLLPHLHQLESLTASHLPLPVYDNDADLPFIHTLRHLRLRSVTIQWMSGRTFHVLERCTLIFPLHRRVLHTFCTTLPHCKDFSFEGYPLDILEGVSAHKLTHLSVVSPYNPRGKRQLSRFSSQALQESRLAPRILHISIEATDEAWTKALTFMSNLEELVIANAQPSSLGVKVLRSLAVHPVHADNVGTTATHRAWITPVCPSLKRFGLRYRRWLRPSERFDLIPEFISIIRTRRESMFFLQSFRIWTRSDQKEPLEVMKGSWMSYEGFLGLIRLKEGVDEDNRLQRGSYEYDTGESDEDSECF